jgi:hypothetical protein
MENKKRRSPRKYVDKGKIIALRKAGWKVKDIAEDVHLSQGKVYEVLRDWGDGKLETAEETDTEPKEDYA